jgi:hypothetical protein
VGFGTEILFMLSAGIHDLAESFTAANQSLQDGHTRTSADQVALPCQLSGLSQPITERAVKLRV